MTSTPPGTGASADGRGGTVPNANSPELLTHLLEMIARGVRSTRGLQEALGVDLRTVHYYLQAGSWLGFLASDDKPVLSALGLEYVYAGQERRHVYTSAVLAHPMLGPLVRAHGPDGPDRGAVARAIAQTAPELAESTVERRVSSIRGLLAPALEERREVPPREAQLELPLAQRPAHEAQPTLTQLAGSAFSPDIYRYLLCTLLDHGELTLGHVRGLLDRAGAADVPIGSYVDLALTRQDAVRVEERLVATRGAVARRALVASTASIILSDAGWRDHLDDVRAQLLTATGPLRLGGPYRRWNERLFGHALRSKTLEADLQRVLRDRSLASYPRTDQIDAALPAVVHAPFLDAWEQPGLVIALPPSLAQLWEGIQGINRRLRNARHRTDAVGLPTPAYRPVAVHGGLLHPGEHLPRAVPDARSLRHRVVMNSPYPAMVVAMLLGHRRAPSAELVHHQGVWEVRRGRRRVGRLFDVLDAFAASRGWTASRRDHGGLEEPVVMSLLERLGLLLALDGRAVLDDTFFKQLREDADEAELYARLDPLSRALADHVSELADRGARRPA